MKKALIGISVLVVLGLLIIAGCSPVKTLTSDNPSGNTGGAGAGTDQVTSPDAYVDDQIIDENATIDVGEMI